jgi:putative ABC transport system permease protein
MRGLARARGVTAAAVATLALGIGATTLAFSLAQAVVFRPLRYPQPDRLVWVWATRAQNDSARFSPADYLDLQAQNSSFEGLSASAYQVFNYSGSGEPERIEGLVCTPNYFRVLRQEAAVGRAFRDDPEPGAPQAVMSHRLWQRVFGGDPAVVGRALRLNEQTYTVAGVMPPGFHLPRVADLWTTPRRVIPESYFTPPEPLETVRDFTYLNLIGRLKPGVTPAQAQADLQAIAARLAQQHASNAGRGVRLVGLRERLTGDVRKALQALLGAVLFVLLIACVNVANLQLALASGRRQEMAVRAALGASAGRLARQSLAESMVLALLGVVAGVALAAGGLQALAGSLQASLPRFEEIRVEASLLWIAGLAGAGTAFLFGLAPAWRVLRCQPLESLKENAQGVAGGNRSGLAGLLVSAEVALAVMLLAGAGLMARSFWNLNAADLGFERARLLTLKTSLPEAKYSAPEQQRQFFEQLLERFAALPGVEAAAAANAPPTGGHGITGAIEIEGRAAAPPGQEFVAGQHVVTEDYFSTLGVPLLRGRAFTPQDRTGAAPVVIVNETLARQAWPGAGAVGKRIQLQKGRAWAEVVGVAADINHAGPGGHVMAEAYQPFAQHPTTQMALLVRSRGDLGELAGRVRGEVQALDPAQPVFEVKTMDQYLGDLLLPRRLNTLLFVLFAVLALTLGAVGVYGVMAHSVAGRTREIGVRMALGAAPGAVLRLVIAQGMKQVLIGLVLGVAGALAFSRYIATLLYGVSPADPLTLAAVSAALAAVALCACYFPARRAARVDPLRALRCE